MIFNITYSFKLKMVLNTRLTLNTGHIFHLEKPNQVNYDKPLIIREIPIPKMLKWRKKKAHYSDQ